MSNWHDYYITGYSVDGENDRLSLNLEWPSVDPPGPKKVILVFHGVAGYFFEHDLGISIILDIEIEDLSTFIDENREFFARESKWGWPKFWHKNAEETLTKLSNEGMRVWLLSTSYGMSGWVVAREVRENA